MPARCSLFGILARDSSRGILFRRGPSNQVLLIAWDTRDDSFEEGQWLKGRVYERRCDLSPKGDKLLYFAAKWKKPYYSWTAVCRPPQLTAIAFWPKGDAWGGGGLFARDRWVRLNHRKEEMRLAPGFKLPRGAKVEPLWQGSGWGEDNPIWEMRLARDGWELRAPGRVGPHTFSAPVAWTMEEPRILAKRAAWDKRVELRMLLLGLGEKNGPWWLVEHEIARPDHRVSLGRSEWADWDLGGDLVYAKDGRVYRLAADDAARLDVKRARVLADFRDRRFVAKEPKRVGLGW